MLIGRIGQRCQSHRQLPDVARPYWARSLSQHAANLLREWRKHALPSIDAGIPVPSIGRKTSILFWMEQSLFRGQLTG